MTYTFLRIWLRYMTSKRFFLLSSLQLNSMTQRACFLKAESALEICKIMKRRQEFTLSALSSVQYNSVSQSCPALCNPMNCSTPGLPVHHQLLEFTQTHVHRVRDAIQSSHPLSSPSPPAPNPFQYPSLFQ